VWVFKYVKRKYCTNESLEKSRYPNSRLIINICLFIEILSSEHASGCFSYFVVFFLFFFSVVTDMFVMLTVCVGKSGSALT